MSATASAQPKPTQAPALLLAILGLLTVSTDLWAQKVVPIHLEPRHRLMLDAGVLKVLDVQILPGDTTYFHVHDSATLYVAMSASSTSSQPLGGEWDNASDGRSPGWEPGTTFQNLRYAQQPYMHRVANVGTHMFRLIAVTNHGQGARDDESGAERGLPGEQAVESRYFRTRRLTLDPGEATPWARSDNHVIGVQVSPAWFQIRKRGGETETVSGLGEFFLNRPGVEFRIRNPGDDPVDVVLVEAR